MRLLKTLLPCLLPLTLTSCDHSAGAQSAAPSSGEVSADAVSAEATTLPRLVDLGATRCIPCRMMAPILDELREEYRGVVSVEFIDVLENPDAANAHAVEIISTQVFFDAQGREVARHQGFMPREDILAQFEAMGIAPPARGDE
jgi:thioredoxin 1